MLGALALVATPTAWGGPEGGTVTAGQAQIGRTGNLTTVAQQSNRAIIDWRSFSVGAAEAVNFRQPDASAVTLNRVIGNDPSAILGRITANGSVFLVNPNGVLFGRGAQVDVGGLVASTANISNANFMAGNYRFDLPGKAGAKVDNQGTIRIANAGIAALVGRQVSNSGFIVATLGKVALAAGDAFVLDLAGDRLVNLILDRSLMEQVQDAQGQPLIARVDNTGNIQANGGRVQLSAATVSSLLDNVINVQGDIRATAVGTSGGVISLYGNETTAVTLGAGGVVQASGTGSRIEATGRDITVAGRDAARGANGAQVDLSLGASLALNATRNITIDSSINALRAPGTTGAQPGGGLSATAGNDLSVNQTIALNDGALSLTATNGTLRAAPGTLLQSGAVAIDLRGGAGVDIDRVLTAGAVNVASAAGAVSLRSAVVAPSSGTAAPVASLTVSARNAVAVSGVLASGGVSLTSTSGDVNLGASTVQSTVGSVTLAAGQRVVGASGSAVVAGASIDASGSAGVSLDSVITPAAVTLRSSQGGVSVARGISASGSAVPLATSAATQALRVEAAGPVALAGAQLGTGGLTVTGAGGSGGAGSFGLTGGSLLSAGNVSVTTSGALSTAALVRSSGSVAMQSTAGTLNVGPDGIVAGPSGISLESSGALTFNGDLVAGNGPIALWSTGNRVIAQVNPARASVQGLASIDAGTDRSISNVTINSGPKDPAAPGNVAAGTATGASGIVLGGIRAAGRVSITSRGNVELLAPLGGAATGYDSFDRGYIDAVGSRPDVGRLLITSLGGSVEVNGLNLDGNADPTDFTTPALRIEAARAIVSNQTIAVNRGRIELVSTGTGATDGVFLGANVLSRGWDSTGQDARRGGSGVDADVKHGYAIAITAPNLGLFDNNADVAEVPGLYRVRLSNGQDVLTNDQAYLVDENGNRLRVGGQFQRIVAEPANSSDPVVVQIDDPIPLSPNAFVEVRTVRGAPIARTVARIEIANNVSNYRLPAASPGAERQFDDRLVPASNAAAASIVVQAAGGQPVNVGGFANPSAGTGNSGGRGLSIASTAIPRMLPLSAIPISVPQASDRIRSSTGLVLKVLGFANSGDESTVVWPNELSFLTTLDATQPIRIAANGNNRFVLDLDLDPDLLQSLNDMSAPVNGEFRVRVAGTFNRGDITSPSSCQLSGGAATCDAIYTFRIDPSDRGRATIQAIDMVNEASLASSPWRRTDLSNADIGSTLFLQPYGRCFTPSCSAYQLTPAGRSASVIFNGSLLTTSSPQAVSSSASGLSGSQIEWFADNTRSIQQFPATQLNGIPTLGQGRSGGQSGYRVTGASMIVGGAFGTTGSLRELGTRLQLFDGVLENSSGAARVDGADGVYLPGSSTTNSGANNSFTGFSSISAQPGGAAGASGGSTALGAGTAPPVVGLGSATEPTPFTPIPLTDGAADRPAQDALAASTPESNSVASDTTTQTQVGLRPSAQADFGRGGVVSGAAPNVFSRNYRVATTTDRSICAPGAVEASKNSPLPASASSGGSEQGDLRVCK